MPTLNTFGSARGFGRAGAARPNQVTELTATDIGSGRAFNNGRIDLAWTAPGNNGATITGYLIERSTNGSTYSTLVANTGSTNVSYSDTGLTSAQQYWYRVSAINAAGTGDASTAANTTATTVPQAPTIGTATVPAVSQAVDVAYTANATGGKAVSVFTATSSPGSITGTGSSPIRVTGLTNGTSYTFTVTATNANGTSLASAASNSVTPVAPLATLGTWSLSTNYPVSASNVRGTALDTSSFITHGGRVGANSIANSYTWNGSTFSADLAGSTVSSSWSNIAGTGDGNVQLMGRFGEAQFGGPNVSNLTFSWNGSSWASATILPISVGFSGAFAWGSNTFSITGGQTGSASYTNASYFRTGTGSFSVGTSAPFSDIASGAIMYNGTAYLGITDGTNRTIYKTTSPSGTWTAGGTVATNRALGSSSYAFVNNTGFARFNNTSGAHIVTRINPDDTFTDQTTSGLPSWQNYGLAPRLSANALHAFAGDGFNRHYISTASV